MTNQEIVKQIQHIINLDKNPLFKDTAVAHLKALLTCIQNDNSELQQAKKEYAAPVPGKIKENNYDKEQHNIDADIVLEHIDDVLVREFDSLTQEENPYNMASTKVDFEDLEAMRKRIFTKIKDKITGRTTKTVPVVQCHAVIKFYSANKAIRKNDLIERAFEGTENDVNITHYKEMFWEMEYDLFRLFEALSEDQMCLIINYIMKNYSGVSIAQIEKYVQ